MNWRTLNSFFRRYRWFFVAEGVLGNFMFFIGSIFFLWPSTQQVGVWLFIAGSGLMLVRSAADAMAEYSRSDEQSRYSQADSP